MNIIFDNIVFELQRAGGISVYWSELISRIKPDQAIFFGLSNSNIFCSDLQLYDVKKEQYWSFLPRRYFPFKPKNFSICDSKHIFHSSYFRHSNNPNAINVTTVHDFTYEYYVKGWRKWLHSWQKRKAIKNSQGIICISENTKKDLLHFYPDIAESRIRVIYNGVSSKFFPVENSRLRLEDELGYQIVRPYMLFVGDRSPYKNFDLALELVSRFPAINLVVVGGKPFSKKEKVCVEKLKGRVHHFQGLSTQTLNLLYNSAFCFVYPSSYEGFGIPILEAMRAGCPVLATRCSSIPEVAGNAALLVDEVSVSGFSEKFELLSDVSFRDSLIKKGLAQANKFSWDRTFKETYELYQDLLL